jgi:hypothetical protein
MSTADRSPALHPLLCGILGPGELTGCPGCLAERASRPPARPAPDARALALARRLRREGVGRCEAGRQALALYGCTRAGQTDRGDAALAAVARAYDDPDPRRPARRRLRRLARRELAPDLDELADALARLEGGR